MYHLEIETKFCNVVLVVDNDVANPPISKAVQVSRSSPAITVPPRSSISLTAFKTSIQPKLATQVCIKVSRYLRRTFSYRVDLGISDRK